MSAPITSPVHALEPLDEWTPAARHPPLSADEVHVWRVELDLASDAIARLSSLLARDEGARSARLLSASAGRAFVVTRAVLRLLLGRYLDRAPAAIALAYGPEGKPALAGSEALHFNVSHSGHRGLLAFGRQRVGVDLERLDHRADHVAIARRFFAPGEAAEILALPEPDARRRFFEIWTRREALLKATGKGWTGTEPTLDAGALGFTLWPLRVPDFAAALAVEGTGPRPRWLALADGELTA